MLPLSVWLNSKWPQIWQVRKYTLVNICGSNLLPSGLSQATLAGLVRVLLMRPVDDHTLGGSQREKHCSRLVVQLGVLASK